MGRNGFDLLTPLFFLPGSTVSVSHTLLPEVCYAKPLKGSEPGNSVPDPRKAWIWGPTLGLEEPGGGPSVAPAPDQPGMGIWALLSNLLQSWGSVTNTKQGQDF